MLYILRAGIKVPIPPAVAAAGGEAIEAYVAARPAEHFPPVPTELLGKDQGPALDAYLAELSAAGVLASRQAAVDAAYRLEEAERLRAAAELAAPAAPLDATITHAQQLARQTIARLTDPVTVTTVVTPPPAVTLTPVRAATPGADEE